MPAIPSDAAPQVAAVTTAEATPGDLGPLAWVMEELRRSLEAVVAVMRQSARTGPVPLGRSDLQVPVGLEPARRHLHLSAGALEMVGCAAPARVVAAMEAAVQVFIDEPARFLEPNALAVERASFAVLEFLEGLLAGKSLSAVALFPQYRGVKEITGADRIHPADLWLTRWTWHDMPVSCEPPVLPTRAWEPSMRYRLDQAVLHLVKSGDQTAARDLALACDRLAAGGPCALSPQARGLWRLAAGFFEAVSQSLLPLDLYVKRTASRVLVQVAAMAKGEAQVSERLAQDLAFFCAQALPADPAAAPRLMAVRQAWGLDEVLRVPYDVEHFGRFDPMLLAQVRKKLTGIREGWSALAGGDMSRLRSTGGHFTQLGEALSRLYPPLGPLAENLVAVTQDLVAQPRAPSAELALEVATVLLFLEAVCQDFDLSDPELQPRVERLADRLARAYQGEVPDPLEPWVEELYRRVSHRQTMGSVVDELRGSIAELEKDLDAYAREPAQRDRLQVVPGRLSQMRGVLSVLGLEHAARTVMHMRDTVTALLQAPAQDSLPDLMQMGNNLGALGFLTDMLGYQPALARKLFVFDEREGELKPVMGRLGRPQPTSPAASIPASQPPPARPEQDTAAAELPPDDCIKVIGPLKVDQALFNVYLNEADEWSRRLQHDLSEWGLDPGQPLPASVDALAHALGGSSSMMGFDALADLARQLEASFQHTQSLPTRTPQHAAAYTEAAEEVRRLLHQFAAGFLPQPRHEVAQALAALGDGSAADRCGTHVLQENPAPAIPPVRPRPDGAGPEPVPAQTDVDPDLFVFFEEEALELLPRLGGALRRWQACPGDPGPGEEVRRALHTLKGSARLAGALQLGGQAHALESMIEGFPHDATPAQIASVIRGFDAFQAELDAMRMGTRDLPAPSSPPDGPPTKASVDVADSGPAPPAWPAAPARTSQAMVRVRTQTLDRLMNQTGEVMISRARLESELGQMRTAMREMGVNIERLRGQLRDIELQSELQMQARRTQDPAGDFDPLEFDRYTRVQELTRMLAESVSDVATVQNNLKQSMDAAEDHLLAQARQTRELQRDLLKTSMVEFESLTERLYRVVRLAAQETGKRVTLEIQGGGVELDRGILERMTPAFEHLLRNAVAHGIEEPTQRAALGKPVEGQLVIRLTQEGNEVAIRFEDDGVGLSLPRIRDRAQVLGLLGAGQELDEADAARLIFTPGFSTAGTVSELAGRGIGMDVVRAEVQALGGRIATHTREGQGTCFELLLPLTTAVTQVVMLRCGSRVFGVPAPLVEVVLSAQAAPGRLASEAGWLSHEGQELPFYWGGALLQSGPCTQGAPDRPAPVVILRSASQRLALQVDEVLGHQEVVVKRLGPQLARLPGLAGISVLASGAVVLIYNPVALAAVYGRQAQAIGAGSGPSYDPECPAAAQAPLVLVVDDSSTVRRVTQRMLEREGYRVALASDGLQALEQLARETPVLVLSDIEMPRMDGFDLVRSLRNDPRWAQLPVVVITSRMAQKHREHAFEIGVDHYLGKPYSEDELLALVRRYALGTLSPPAS